MERLEEKLSRLTDMLDQAMPAVAIGIDVLDEEVRKAQDRGVDVDQRLRRAGELVEKLTEPAVLDGIEKLVAHAPLAAEGAELAATAPAYTAIAIDVMDEEIRKLQHRGVDVDERLRRAGALVEKLTDPSVLDSLETLVAHAPLAAEGAELAATAPAYTAIAIDVMDEEIRKLQADGVDVDKALDNGATLLRALGRFLASSEGQQLIESGLLEPDTIHRITQISSAVVTTLNEEPPLIGPWGSFVRTWDRRFQRFAGFSFALAWRVGALLGPNGKSLPAPRS